jgi:hypothetical protein
LVSQIPTKNAARRRVHPRRPKTGVLERQTGGEKLRSSRATPGVTPHATRKPVKSRGRMLMTSALSHQKPAKPARSITLEATGGVDRILGDRFTFMARNERGEFKVCVDTGADASAEDALEARLLWAGARTRLPFSDDRPSGNVPMRAHGHWIKSPRGWVFHAVSWSIEESCSKPGPARPAHRM